ncbi:PABS domain-containing protein [Trichostrongylus colubriformis]|uniref:PABS domain-containing protein n=1 Tax=Trichostrongylus colubriformis TaxID=6319 RepID=A0AAN8F2Q1_TRICO
MNKICYNPSAMVLTSILHMYSGESIQLHRGYCVDLKTWSIDRNTVVASYIARMLAAPFVMSTLSLDSDNAGKQFLEIGLGGGTLDTALHARKPKVNITAVDIDEIVVKKVAKWFGIRDSRYHHSITEDGVKFVDNAIAEGRKFDVVAIDACDDNHWLPCPAEEFRTEEGLEKIKKVMNDNGTVTVNFLPRIQMNQTVWDEALESYQSVFPTCMLLKARSANVVLVCVPFEVPDTLEFQRLYKQRLTEVISAFKLDETLNGFATLEILPNLTF